MKLFAALMISLFFAFSTVAQTRLPLDAKLSEMFKQNFAEWKVENPDKAFYPVISHTWKYNPENHKAADITGIESIWKLGDRQVIIDSRMTAPPDMRSHLDMFLIRNITPPHRKIDDLAEQAYLVQFSERVEVAFVKENMFTIIYMNFPAEKGKGEAGRYQSPPAEIDTILKIAGLVAAEIEGAQNIETLTGIKSK